MTAQYKCTETASEGSTELSTCKLFYRVRAVFCTGKDSGWSANVTDGLTRAILGRVSTRCFVRGDCCIGGAVIDAFRPHKPL